MLAKIGLEGHWKLQLDERKEGLRLPFHDTITLPGTTSCAQKGKRNDNAEVGALTEEYPFAGHAWFSREIDIPEELAGTNCLLYLERTRLTTVWVNDQEAGSQNSLCAPHIYDVTQYLAAGRNIITIRVDNTGYPTKGGHMTSRDTQTNWNGITGRMELQFYGKSYLRNVQAYPDINARSLTICGEVVGSPNGTLTVSAIACHGDAEHIVDPETFTVTERKLAIHYALGDGALLWSESTPHLYKLQLKYCNEYDDLQDMQEIVFGLRSFEADGDKFAINGVKTFLRGKHDGLIFPRTGFAPTSVEEWLEVLGTAKSYGINHYRFHTCCPPEAAFQAADMLGIYMEPELPFWGIVTDEGDDRHNQAEQDYLIQEGFAILSAFGNHPSFVMMSLGNELWGSKTKLNAILKAYKAYDNRHLYTQGSNNFQFTPTILEEEDFFCGVRFSRDRLFRGSYAMCDAPQGHVQTDRPSTMKDYDEQIVPTQSHGDSAAAPIGDGTIQIQYGTEARTVQADREEEVIPHLPVLSHEIGQYAMYPRFAEIEKYTGPVKARNFEIFRERLAAKGMADLADRFFESSGKLAVACYKEELEAAFRSKRLAGFQLLDLQDFCGQGTALVGILDAFMESKGLVTPEEWRTYCSETVLLARFEKYNYVAGELFTAKVELCDYSPRPFRRFQLLWELKSGDDKWASGEWERNSEAVKNHTDLGDIRIRMPDVDRMTACTLSLSLQGTAIHKTYDLWVYPKEQNVDFSDVHLFHELTDEAVSLLDSGENVMLMPAPDRLNHAIEGTYCTDFWCYPMFRSISESMGKPVPIGTLGLLIDNTHPALEHFPSETHSTYPWWSIVRHSRSLILDETPQELKPIVQTIDNFERNHKLGLLFESRVLNGNLLICPLDVTAVSSTPEGRQFLYSLKRYVQSEQFQPRAYIELADLQQRLSTTQ